MILLEVRLIVSSVAGLKGKKTNAPGMFILSLTAWYLANQSTIIRQSRYRHHSRMNYHSCLRVR